MKKKLMHCAALALTLLALQVSVLAATNASEVIRRTNASAIAVGNGEIKFRFEIYGTKILEQIGVYKVDVFSESEGMIETYYYYQDGYEDLMGYDLPAYDGEVIFEGEPGETYYGRLTFYASDGNQTDSDDFITNHETAY